MGKLLQVIALYSEMDQLCSVFMVHETDSSVITSWANRVTCWDKTLIHYHIVPTTQNSNSNKGSVSLVVPELNDHRNVKKTII